MKKINRYFIKPTCAVLLSLCSTIALAEVNLFGQGGAYDAGLNGPYISAFLGANKPLNETFEQTRQPFNAYELRSHWGLMGGGAFGYRYQMFRAELSIDHSVSHGANLRPSISFVGAGSLDLGDDSDTGKQKMTTVMFNGIYDWRNPTNIFPYLGVGIGWGHLRHEFHHESETSTDSQMIASDNVAVYQGILGVGWNMSDKFKAFIDYRLSSTTKADLKFTQVAIPFADQDGPGFAEVRGHHTSHKINIGLSYFIK